MEVRRNEVWLTTGGPDAAVGLRATALQLV